jgi:5-methyltetrahydrofolate--homocysteine methyltransferase
VTDASRAVGVVSRLLAEDGHEAYDAEIRAEYEALRVARAERDPSRHVTLAAARANALHVDPAKRPARPARPGLHVLDPHPLADLVGFIDWTPFFQSWELAGSYPRILTDARVGAEATKLFADAQALLKRIVDEGLLTARAVVELMPANRDGDDVIVWTDESRANVRARLPMLRQQNNKQGTGPNLCLADFLVPVEAGVDWLGAFCVTAGHGTDALAKTFEADHDDYNSILAKALSDRLAEAFAERLHHLVRTELWGYAEEDTDAARLADERYQGIRPAPGYPACPDHTAKRSLWSLIDPTTRAGVELTESCAMWPAASVSGWYFAHPEARYFGVGRLLEDQVVDYAARKGMSLDEARRWLGPNLL